MKLQSNGDVVLKLKTRYSDGTSHLLFSGLEFVEKLAALVPPPRIHLTRYFGCLAPHSKNRSKIVPQKQEIEAPTVAEITEKPNADPKKKKYLSWATLLARVFDIDILTCPDCQGKLKIVAAIKETGAIKRILGHLDLPNKPPNISPSRFSPQFDFS